MGRHVVTRQRRVCRSAGRDILYGAINGLRRQAKIGPVIKQLIQLGFAQIRGERFLGE